MTGKDFELIPPKYNPADVEKKLYGYWENSGFFKPRPGGRPYCIAIPPPNITGSLHMGHALNNSIQDALARYKRMRGMEVLWMPGVDHAGIAAQNVVDRNLRAEGLSREALGREKFIERVWDWKQKYGDDIVSQLRLLGSSCDWSSLRFTMDEEYSRSVIEEFVTLYEQGYIYRGDRLINWCTKCETALSDIEVEYRETEGKLYYINYAIDSNASITVATTRPETMLGDTALAVHPDDARYSTSAGREAKLPILGRMIPVIADERVRMDFGTGAVKITPAHDPLDYEIGLTHKLPVIKVIGEDGRMTPAAGPYAGLDARSCREKVLEKLEKDGLLVKVEPHEHSTGCCYRCGCVIEPLVSLQWFVKMDGLSAPAAEAVRDGSVKFTPESWKNVYLDWMDNVRDWCISRQIWWGHRIPAWHCESCGFINVKRTAPKKCEKCASGGLKQEEDVLDTWFSSALWPFAGLGWPEDTSRLRRFYPTAALVTGHEIIYFWVARMVMTGIKFMGEPPFSDVYIHGIVRDSTGKKMSKSLGNVVDPRDVIAVSGTDALRLALLSSLGSQDIKFGGDRLDGMKNFVNKLWNAGRFMMMNLKEAQDIGFSGEDLTLDDRWILSETQSLISLVTDHLEAFKFQDACQALYDFIWHKFCDWYLELAKPRLADPGEAAGVLRVLFRVWGDLLKMLHPFCPFVSEELWMHLPESVKQSESLMTAPWPEPDAGLMDIKSSRLAEKKFDVIRTARKLRLEQGLAPSAPAGFEVVPYGEDERVVLEEGIEGLKKLLNASGILIRKLPSSPSAPGAVTESGSTVHIILGESDREKQLEKLQKEFARVEKDLESCRVKLANDLFILKAPGNIVSAERDREKELLTKKEKLSALIRQAD